MSLPVTRPVPADRRREGAQYQSVAERAATFVAMVFKPGGRARIAPEILSAHSMMLTTDHPAQPGEKAFSEIRMNAVLAIGLRVVDAFEIETIAQEIPVRNFVRRER